MARLLLANGTERQVTPRNARAGFTLPELYRLLSCTTVESVALGEGYLIVDEDGKYTKHERNAEATRLLRAAGGAPADFVTGDALVVGARELL